MTSMLGQRGGAGNIQPRRDHSLPNRTVHLVREPGHTGTAAGDRRVRRTRQALVGALVELVLEKRYDAITIQNLLDRADVGRATFYAHYRGKDDLLLGSFEGLLEALDRGMDHGGAPSRRLAPARELFHHVGQMGEFHRALARAHMLDRVYQAGTNALSQSIARRLAGLPGATLTDSAALPALAHGFAGALFAMLRWWVDHDTPCSAERMDELYHTLLARSATDSSKGTNGETGV
jgi:AcrR family transcriptional regulator